MIYEFCYFNNELDILAAKLDAAKDKVDRFIIIESPTDLLHRPKPLYYMENRDRLSDHAHKIIHVIPKDSSQDKIGYALFRERLSKVRYVLEKCKPNDIIIISDPDVVLRPETYDAVERMHLDENEGVVSCRWYQYYMDYQYGKYHEYTNVFLFKNTVAHEWETVHRWKPVGDVIVDGGWHFSKLGGVDAVMESISGYPHLELDTPEKKNRETLLKKMEEGIAWDDDYPGTPVFSLVPYDPANYPKYVNEHPEIFTKYFKGGMGCK